MNRELSANSRLSLLQFWGRRIRRLLPAAFLVLAVSLVAVYLWVPSTLWESTVRQVGTSALYVQNWVLAADSVDYSAMNASATVAEHYWSLSIEEQFYVLWPLAMVALLWAMSHVSRRVPVLKSSRRTVLIFGLSVIAAVSLAYSIHVTQANPAADYFVTPTRIWEFALGALAALVLLDRTVKGRAAAILAWVGLRGIVVSALLYSSNTLFPGYTAQLPVLGSVLVISSEARESRLSLGWWLSRRPATFVGDISYYIYLWHWPMIVVVPFALKTQLNWPLKLAILALSMLLAWVTKLLVEDRFRKGPILQGTVRAHSFTAIGRVLVLGLGGGLGLLANQPLGNNAAVASSPCYGPRALNAANGCDSILGDAAPNPAPVAVSRENTDPAYPGCQADAEGTSLVSCTLGVPADQAKTTVAIVGDSHATAWLPALTQLAKKHDWRVVTYTKSSCPATVAVRILPNEKNSANQDDCSAWGQKVGRALKSNKSISTVFTASYSSAYTFKSAPVHKLKDPAIDGFTQQWSEWKSAGKKVVVFDDVPRTNGDYVPTCVAANTNDLMNCAVPVSQAIPNDMNITKAADKAKGEGIVSIDLKNDFCDAKWCYPVVGSTIVYRDYSHLSVEYSKALAPYIDKQLHSLATILG